MSATGSVDDTERARRWLAGRLAESLTANVPANQPRLLAILDTEFNAHLATFGADPGATHDECERQGWVGHFVIACPLVDRLRALGPAEVSFTLRLPSVAALGDSKTTAARLRRESPEALLMAMARLGVTPGQRRVTVITDRVFGRPASPAKDRAGPYASGCFALNGLSLTGVPSIQWEILRLLWDSDSGGFRHQVGAGELWRKSRGTSRGKTYGEKARRALADNLAQLRKRFRSARKKLSGNAPLVTIAFSAHGSDEVTVTVDHPTSADGCR